jgi:hypothetical protein
MNVFMMHSHYGRKKAATAAAAFRNGPLKYKNGAIELPS